MKVTTQTSARDEFISNEWSSDNGATVVSILRKQLRAAAGVFPELRDYAIYPNDTPTAKK